MITSQNPLAQGKSYFGVSAVLRRIQVGKQTEDTKQIETHGLTIDLDKHQVLTDNGPIDLTATEFKLITLFARSPGRVFTRDVLMDVIWGQELLRHRPNGGHTR